MGEKQFKPSIKRVETISRVSKNVSWIQRETPKQVCEPEVFSTTEKELEPQEISKDYTDANTYVTDFYKYASDIHNGLVHATDRAITNFTLHSTIPRDNFSENLIYQLIRIVLGILPGTSAVVSVFERVAKGLQLAINASRLASIAGVVAQRTASGIFTATQTSDDGSAQVPASQELDNLADFDRKGAASIQAENDSIRKYVQRIGEDPLYHGKMFQLVQDCLGPLKLYDVNEMLEYERSYELVLYKNYYVDSGKAYYIEHDWSDLVPCGVYKTTELTGIPDEVLNRIRSLKGWEMVVGSIALVVKKKEKKAVPWGIY